MRSLLSATALVFVLGCGAIKTDAPPCTSGALGFEALAERGEGVKIASIIGGGPADQAGLQSGDRLLEIGGEKISFVCHVMRGAFHRSCEPVVVAVLRDGQRVEKTLQPTDQATLYGNACKAGDAVACFRAAGDNPDPKVIEAACNNGSGPACTLDAQRQKDDMRALELYTRACNLGDARGCYGMGIFYDLGRGTSTNNNRAAFGYEQACDGGVPMACTDLGYLYERGSGLISDARKAADLYRRGCEGSACEPSNIRGCVNLGDLYRDGDGVAKDEARAAEIFRTACNDASGRETESQRHACVLYGALQLNGLGVPKDVDAGFKVSQEGCAQGDTFGCFNAAVVHVWRDEYRQAAPLYEKACEGGDAEGCYELGTLYDEGQGVESDRDRAVELFAKACQGGFRKACGV